MFITVRSALRWVVMLGIAWAALVYGLPLVRSAIPPWCARWRLAGGFCGSEVQATLADLDAWVQRVLRPLPRHARVKGAVTEANDALRAVEAAVRERAGDERVNRVSRAAAGAIKRVEAVLGSAGDVRGKIGAVPANADLLLAELRRAFERLQTVLQKTGRRAEEVSEAVGETQKALDALSEVLPNSGK